MVEPKEPPVPEILPGDLIRCKETDDLAVIGGVNEAHNGHDTKWKATPLPGARIKTAWWKRDEFTVVVKGPAHDYWGKALKRKRLQDDQAARESDIDWIIENWPLEEINTIVIRALLREAGMLPDQLGLASRGEIGIMAMQLFGIYQRYESLFDDALRSEDPRNALSSVTEVIRGTQPVTDE